MTIPRRYRGPSASGNGGYTCGLLAAFVGVDAVEVTLRSRPPLDRPLAVHERDEGALLLDDDVLVAEAAPGRLDIELPTPIGAGEAHLAERRYAGFDGHVFPECFVCGPALFGESGDPLAIARQVWIVARRDP